jgi:acyl transferase domain-containing protein/acyl carrier protein
MKTIDVQWARGLQKPPATLPHASEEGRSDTQTATILLPDRATVQAWLITQIAELIGTDPGTIDIRDSFASHGVASIDAVYLSGLLEEWLGRTLPDSILYDYPSIDALSRYLSHNELEEELPFSRPQAAATTEQQALTTEPIAIIGMACRFPGGAHTPEAFWQLLKNGTNAISEVPSTRWNSEQFYDADPDASGKMYTRHGGFLQDITQFDASFFGISPREALRMDPQQRLLLEVAWEALENAGLPESSFVGSQTGVFCGFMQSQSYAQLQLQASQGACADDPYFSIGSSASITSGRLSYLFDLQGPSIAVDTACSSSLVATHLACQSLRKDECKLALVGGVNAIIQPSEMVNACKMRMLSKDGRCKTFDQDADGFALGEGCGVVVLKCLSNALADGNTILAIIRGSAINQDGHSNGITAPNRAAQEAVIAQAIANATIEPHQVQYVEAHGSGTALGDLIEISALGAALGEGHSTDRPLLVGSVKTNVGHLAGAAGMAGLFKTVLALQHREIPPHLNLHTHNPQIAWEQLPIAIPRELTPWPCGEEPCVAGVSSFGWSGTNAHLILQEAPVMDTPSGELTNPADQEHQLLIWSAKTESALDTATQQLATYLKQHPEVRLSDIASLYQVGRTAFRHRRMLVCRDSTEAFSELEEHGNGCMLDAICSPDGATQEITFMFPGLGDHYVDMARQLYLTEPVFKTQIDLCCELLQDQMGYDLRQILYPAGSDLAQIGTQENAEEHGLDLRKMLRELPEVTELQATSIQQTSIAQPVLFIVEYALAQLWRSWGVQPQAMIGYSLGEYVAACLAGVLSLEDALSLVAYRARLIQCLPAGTMLAVMLPEQDVLPLLDPELSLSAINGPDLCVVGGPTAAIAELERLLTSRGTACRRLQTAHAFHSKMMEPIQQELYNLVSTFDLQPPVVPYISNVTGTWITARQTTDPAYWVQHLLQTVRFNEGLQTLSATPQRILLEVGPGQMLSGLALQYASRHRLDKQSVLPTLRHSSDTRTDREVVLQTVGQLWLSGVAIDWKHFSHNTRPGAPALPNYPFKQESYWVEGSQDLLPTNTRQASSREKKKLAVKDWFHIPVWKQARPTLASEPAGIKQTRQNWLVFADSQGVGSELVTRLQQDLQQVTLVHVAETLQHKTEHAYLDTYTLNPSIPEHFVDLVTQLTAAGHLPDVIIHACNITDPTADWQDPISFEAAQQEGFYSLLFLARALGQQQQQVKPIQLLVLSNNMQNVLGNEGTRPDKATMLGVCKVLPKENTRITCRSIDIELSEPGSPVRARLIEQLLTESKLQTADTVVAYRGEHRWTQTFEALPLEECNEGSIPLRARGTYLLTGGTGGLGLALAEHLANVVPQVRLVLVERSPLPAQGQWAVWLNEHPEQDPTSQKILRIQHLKLLGAEVLLLAGDVTDLAAMQAVVERTHQCFGNIHGVIHTAGVPGEGIIQLKTAEKAAQVLAPKLQGTLILDQVLRDEPLDFLTLYASINAVTGGLGEVDYSAANAFLDAYAHYARFRRPWPVASIDWSFWQWDAWQSKVFAALPEVQAQFQQVRERYGISFQEGADAWQRIIAARTLSQVLVLPQGFQDTLEQLESLTSLNFLDVAKKPATPVYRRPQQRQSYVAPRDELEQMVASVWQEFLGIEEVGIHDHFFELGGNSLISMLIVSRLGKMLQKPLTVTTLFEGPTISSFAEVIRPKEQTGPTLAQHSSRGKLRRERLKKQH